MTMPLEDRCAPSGAERNAQESIGRLTDCISVMQVQEVTRYRCPDYLPQLDFPGGGHRAASSKLKCKLRDDGVDEFCREQICEWMYTCADYFGHSREIVSIAMSYLDRFAGTATGTDPPCRKPKREYRLAALVSLRLAIKLYSSSELNLGSFAQQVGSGAITEAVMHAMEMRVLQSLSWHVHPPTALGFVRCFLKLLPDGAGPSPCLTKRVIFELARYMTELAVCEYYFASERPSRVAFASILNAVDCVAPGAVPAEARGTFLRRMDEVAGMGLDRGDVEPVRDELWAVFEQSQGLDAFMAAVDPEGLIYAPAGARRSAAAGGANKRSCRRTGTSAIALIDGQIELTASKRR